MHVAVYSTRRYDREFLDRANAAGRHRLDFLEARLEARTVPAAGAAEAVRAVVNDRLDATMLQALHARYVPLPELLPPTLPCSLGRLA